MIEKELQPGRELDALVAEKVMGWSHDPNESLTKYWVDSDEDNACLPDYSTDIAAAWKVLNKLGELGFIWGMSPSQVSLKRFGIDEEFIRTEGSSIPHAICLAALKAVMTGVEVDT